MLKELIADMHLSTGDCVGGAWATCGPYTSPLSPADELRRQAKDIEARDALLTRARALVQQCNEK
jgi:hypothetical protein